MIKQKFFYSLYGIFICIVFGWLGSNFQKESLMLWYPYLDKSILTPPNIVFPIVWSILYIFMGISIGAVFTKRSVTSFVNGIKYYHISIILFIIQLFLNVIWNFLFFYLKNPLLGFIDIILIIISVILYMWYSYKINKISSLLMLPYLLWLIFACYLNGYIYFTSL